MLSLGWIGTFFYEFPTQKSLHIFAILTNFLLLKTFIKIYCDILIMLLTCFVQDCYRGYQAAIDCQAVAGKAKRVYRVAVVNYYNNNLVVFELPIRYYEKKQLLIQ